MPPGIWAMVDNSPSQFLGDAALRHAHLPHVAVLLHRGLSSAACCIRSSARAVSGRTAASASPCRWSPAGWCCFRSSASSGSVGITKVFGGTPPAMPEMPKVLGAFPLTHLWFLYQLLLIVRGGDRCCAPSSRALDRRSRNCARWSTRRVVRALRFAHRALFTLGLPRRRRADVAAVLVLLAWASRLPTSR